MIDKISPLAVHSAAHRTDELTTVTTVVSSWLWRFDAFSTCYFFWFFDILESLLNLHEVVDMKRWLEARHTSGWGKEGGLSAGRAT